MAVKWVGFPNSAGVPGAIGDETNYSNDSDRTYCRRWTASENGTITGVNIRPAFNDLADMFIVVYRQVNGSGDIDKIAQMDIADDYSQTTWRGYETAVVFGGESLAFSTNDILWFGVGFDGATGVGGLSRDIDDATGEVNNQYNTSSVNPSTGPNSTLTFTTSGSARGLCTILRYDDGVGGGIAVPIYIHHSQMAGAL